jgi:nucleotide-binding universal stress UspA family protein
MAAGKKYFVPVDFSKTSEAALEYAAKLARENRGEVVLLHVIPTSALMITGPDAATGTMIAEVEKAQLEEAQKQMDKLVRKKRMKPGTFRSLIVKRGDPARVIAERAKKIRAAMIIMGSHGRTGLKRLVLGSVAERSLRYSHCPVLIVKK